jgi:hypothetical protein
MACHIKSSCQEDEGRRQRFKPIFGVEAYFVPSISEWKEEYEKVKAR